MAVRDRHFLLCRVAYYLLDPLPKKTAKAAAKPKQEAMVICQNKIRSMQINKRDRGLGWDSMTRR